MFVGRKHEMDLLEKALRPGVKLALVGSAGVGKTAIARELAERRPNSVVVECGELSQEELPFHIAQARGIEPDPELASVLEGVELLVLDDWSGAFDLDELPYGGALVTTGYEAPDGATTLPVHPFEVPGVDQLLESEAYGLFEAEVERVRLGAMVQCAPESVLEIVGAVGGHPLGIAVAAQHAATVGAGEIARLVRDGVELRDDSRSPRQQSVAAALEYSWKQLDDRSRRVFFLACRFPRPVRVTSLATLAELDVSSTMAVVRRLTERGALSPGALPRPVALWRDVAQTRFSAEDADSARELTDRIFRLALETARDATDVVALDDRPSYWEAALVDAADVRPLSELGEIAAALLTWSYRFAADRYRKNPHVVEAVERSKHWPAVLQYTMLLRQLRDEHRMWGERCVEIAATEEERAASYFELALNSSSQGNIEDALRLLAKAREHGGTIQSDVLELDLHVGAQDLVKARETLALLRARELKSAAHLAMVEFYATWLTEPQHRLKAAEHYLEVATAGGSRSLTLAWRVLGDVLEHNFGRDEEAREARLKARDLGAEIASTRVEANADADLRWGTLCRGELDEARGELADLPSAPLYSETVARVTTARAFIACLDEDLDEAARLVSATKRQISHMPPIHRLYDVVDAALALQRGESAVPDGELPQLMKRAWVAKTSDQRDQLTLYNEVASVRADPKWWARFTKMWLERFGPPLFQRLDRLAEVTAHVVLLDDCTGLRIDGVWHHVTETSAQLLDALAGGEAVTFEQLQSAAWPDEVIDWDSLVNRVNVRVSQLRKLGLKPYLLKTSDGFVLECEIYREPAAD